MHNVGYITAELSLLCKEYKSVARDAANKGRAERIAEQIQRLVEELSDEASKRFNTDSVFFAGELDHHKQEYETLYPGDEHRDADDDSESSNGGEQSGGHGNTRLPYGLCEKYGIEVQKGWTPREAWSALAGKGVSAAEEYKKLRERGRAATQQKASVSGERHTAAKKSLQDKQNEVAARIKELKKDSLDARNREIDIRFGKLSDAKSRLLIAEQEATKAKKRQKDIAGRTKEQIEADMNEYMRRVKEADEMNNKLYDRPGRRDPGRAEWDAWLEKNGGWDAVSQKVNFELINPEGAREKYSRDERLFNREYDRYGPDGGLKEARKKVRALKKECEGYEHELSEIDKKIESNQRQQDEMVESLKPMRQEYYDSVKERFPTFDDCKTPADVAERLSAEGIFDGLDITCDFGEKISIDTAKTTAKSLTDFISKVPCLSGHCGRLAFEDMTGEEEHYYGFSKPGGGVRLNNRWYGDEKAFEESWQRCMDTKYHPEGLTKESIVHHEYSHQLDDYLTRALNIRSGQFSTVALNEVSSRLGMDRQVCKESVSRYSVDNISGGDIEWFAEAMSEYTSSPNPRSVAVALGEYVMERAQELMKERHDAADDDEEGRWVTTDNGHKVHINEEGEPDKGNPHVLAVMEGKKGKKPKATAKDTYEQKIKDIVNSGEDYDQQVEKMEKVIMTMPVGSKLDFPESWNDGEFKSYAVHEGKGVWRYHYGKKKDESYTIPKSEMAGYMMSDDESERPKISKLGKGLGSRVAFKTETDTTKVLNEFLKLEDAEDYWKARARGLSANDDREQFRMFGRYMRGVGYGSDGHEAFNSYVYHGDGLINGMLRGLVPKSMKQQQEWTDNAEQTKQYIDKMTEKINENPLRDSACVYRGIKTKSGLMNTLGLKVQQGVDIETLFDNPDFLGSLVGHTFSDPGFTSTSIDRDVPSKGGFSRMCSMEIYCPSGTKGTYFGDALKLTDEYEFLLQRGTQFVITDAECEDIPFIGKRLKLKVAVVRQEPQEIPDIKKRYEPNERIVFAGKNKETIPKEELKKMYDGLSDGAMDDLVRMHEEPQSNVVMTVDEMLREEMFVGNIAPEKAGEIAAYASRVGVAEKIDDYVRWDLDQHNRTRKPMQETVDAAASEFPGVPQRILERIAEHRDEAARLRESAQIDAERYGESSISKYRLRDAEAEEKCVEYLIRAYERSKEREKK